MYSIAKVVMRADEPDHDRQDGSTETRFSSGCWPALCTATMVSASLITITGKAGAARFMGLGDLAGGIFDSSAGDISADGSVVVGTSQSDRGWEAYRWTAETGMVGLGYLPVKDESSGAIAASADGSVVVGESRFGLVRLGGQWEAFRWTAEGGMVGLGDLPGGLFRSQTLGVSDDGSVVVGQSSSRRFFLEPFRWTEDSGMVGLGFSGNAHAISGDGSVIVGSDDSEAFRWTAEAGKVGLGYLPGRTVESHAYDVSSDGSVVVGDSWATNDFRGREAFRWTADDGMIGLGAVPSYAWTVSADGSLVGGGSRIGVDCAPGRIGCAEAFIWDETHGMRNVKALLVNEFGLEESLEGWDLFWVQGISADGLTIVGGGRNPSGREEAWLAHLGEPIDEFDCNGDGTVTVLDVNCATPASVSQTLIAANLIAGDADGDGHVRFSDFLILSSNFNMSGQYTNGDFDFDGQVQFSDFLILSQNFGQSSTVAAAVPEPSTIGLALFGVVGMLTACRFERAAVEKLRRCA